MKKRIGLLIVLSLATLMLGAGEYKVLRTGDAGVPDTVIAVLSDSGDTARVLKIQPKLAIDSQLYICTLTIPHLGTDSIHDISWTSPLQSLIITPTHATATYSCSLAFASEDTLEFEIVLDGSDTTTALIVDSLVYFFNNTTNLKDSVVAHDSVTYCKLISKFSEITFDGRWELQFDVTSTGDLDTASTVTTVAMVCDSLVATCNAADSGADFVTAYDSTTFYIIQSDDKGLPFFVQDAGALGFHADTLDTTHTQLNVTSRMIGNDTVHVGNVAGFATLQGKIVLFDCAVTPENATTGCLGNDDSARIWLYTDRAGELFLVDSGLYASPPCTLNVEVPRVTGDTLLEHDLYIRYWWDDSCTDVTTADNAIYPIYWDIKLK